MKWSAVVIAAVLLWMTISTAHIIPTSNNDASDTTEEGTEELKTWPSVPAFVDDWLQQFGAETLRYCCNLATTTESTASPTAPPCETCSHVTVFQALDHTIKNGGLGAKVLVEIDHGIIR